jgi:anti-sigma-K factor RskA
MQVQHVVDLLDAYVLGALEPDEVDIVDRHLDECADCRAAAEDVRSLASQLLLAAPQTPPPSALRARVLGAIRTEAATREQIGPTPSSSGLGEDTPVPRSAPPADNPVARLLRGVFGGGGSADAEVDRLLVDLMADPACEIWPTAGTEHAPSAGGRLIAVPTRREAVLLAYGLRPAPRGQQYQVWLLRSGTPTPNTLFQVEHDGHASRIIRAPHPVGDFEVVAVTPEPQGGSPQPTGPIVLSGKLS